MLTWFKNWKRLIRILFLFIVFSIIVVYGFWFILLSKLNFDIKFASETPLSTIHEILCPSGSKILLQSTIRTSIGGTSALTYLFYETSFSKREIGFNTMLPFPSYLKVENYFKFIPIDNGYEFRNTSRTKPRNLYVNPEQFSLSEFKDIGACLKSDKEFLNNNHVSSVSYIEAPDLWKSQIYQQFNCPDKKSAIQITKTVSRVFYATPNATSTSGYLYRNLGYIDENRKFVGYNVKELQECKNSQGQNLLEFYTN